MKTIFLVRHGESESNVAGLMSGTGKDVAITVKGRGQAKKAGQELKDKGIELIVCSPLKRTQETASIIAVELGYDVKQIVINPLFTERSYGIYEGGPMDEFYKDSDNNKVSESAETTEQMHKRLSEALDWLKTLDAKTILVVSHGGASRAVRVIDQKLHHSHMYKLENMQNASIYEFRL